MYLLVSLVSAAPPAPLEFPAAAACTGRAVDVTMVGDVMQHGEQHKASIQPDGSYSWRGVFEAVAPLIRDADLAIANLETPVDSSRSYAGFPFFNAPEALLEALSEAGFDILQTANNHCLDRGRSGALATLESVARHGFLAAGTWPDAAARANPWVISTLPDGIRVAFLANTYGTNGVPMPEGEPWLVNWLDEGQMDQDIHRARAHADIVIVGLHWGAEYQDRPMDWQRTLARRLVDSGADIVMGSHPHVVQPAEVWTTLDPQGPRDGLILYSLGNFVSNQRTFPRDGGLLARATLQRCGERVRVAEAVFTPVWVDDRVQAPNKAFRVLPVPPEGAACGALDLTDEDCRQMVRFREHVSTLVPAPQFDWTAGDRSLLALRPVPNWPRHLTPTDDPVVPTSSLWPPPAMIRSQADP